MPVVLNPENMDSTMKKMLGCLPVVNQVVIDKNEADGSYQTSVHVAAGGFTANAYPTYGKSNKHVEYGVKNYFVVTAQDPLQIRSSTKIAKDNILGSADIGSVIQVITKDGKPVRKAAEGNKYHWVEVKYENEKN